LFDRMSSAMISRMKSAPVSDSFVVMIPSF
jgi:hypothetical protein